MRLEKSLSRLARSSTRLEEDSTEVVEACEELEEACEDADGDETVDDCGGAVEACDEAEALDAAGAPCVVEDWPESVLMGGSWVTCCWALDWFAPNFVATSNIPVTPTTRRVVVAIAVLRNSRLFMPSHGPLRSPTRYDPGCAHAFWE